MQLLSGSTIRSYMSQPFFGLLLLMCRIITVDVDSYYVILEISEKKVFDESRHSDFPGSIESRHTGGEANLIQQG